jgi:outer membrane receptor protein involved in Fe transport
VATASAATKTDVAQATPSTNGTLTGKVTNSDTNQPIGGATVNAQGSNGSFNTTTIGDGTFSLSLPAGIYDLSVNRGGFQGASASGYPIAAGTTSNITISMLEASSSTLRTIGQVSVSRRSTINTSPSSVAVLSSAVIQQRDLPNLEDTVSELPGVTLARTSSSTANLFFNVRGTWAETKVNIDGHPLSPGTFGTWNANYAASGIFDSVDVLKGAGLNGPTAGESAFGTVNLQTRDFSPHNYFEVKGGLDSYNGGFYSMFGNVNLLNNRLSILAGRTYSGYNGPSDNYTANRIGTFGTMPLGTGQVPSYTALDQYESDLSDRYSLEGELLKARYRLSPSTSISGEFLGLQGQYSPQAGSYASLEGNATIQQCFNGFVAASGAGCTTTSVYNPPYANNLIGQTVPQYSFFPDSQVQNNEPEFTAEFRTAFHNDTLLVRPYVALINRFINGAIENQYPGENGGWYQVTNVANCQEVFQQPTAGNGGVGKGPCFGSNMTPGASPAYIGAAAPAFPVVYPTTTVAPTCTAASPCYTTSSVQANNGTYGYGTPFSQPEIDRLRGFTFQYLHPFGDNLVTFSYDYHTDDTFSTTGDTTTPYPGCATVVGSVSNTLAAAGPEGVQPGCTGLLTLARTSISIPPTQIHDGDFALTGLFQVTPRLQLGLGAYYEHYYSYAQTENPAILNDFALNNCTNGVAKGTPGCATTTASAPVSLVGVPNSFSAFNPHVGLVYRANPDIALRATAGSSATMPYASLISGLGSVTIPNAANNEQYTVVLANTGLLPESTVAYDVGADFRVPNGSILSIDGFNDTVHNIFMSQTIGITCPAAFDPTKGGSAQGGCYQSETLNGPIGRYYGAEITFSRIVPIGFGYYLTATTERAYLNELPISLYTASSPLVNLKQLDGSVNSQGSVPFTKGYAELRWTGPKHELLTFGMDYEGQNNSTYGPAFTLFNSTMQWDILPQTTFQVAVDNVFNYNTGAGIVRALFGQGSFTVGLAPNVAGNPSLGLHYVNAFSSPKSIQQLNPRTFRFTLSRRITD